MTTREAEYNDQDRALIAASKAADDVPRGRHGLPLSVSTDIANWGQFVVEPTRDFALEALNAEKKRWHDENGDAVDADAMLWRVRLAESD